MNIQKLHTEAIEYADIAFIKKFQGNFDEAQGYFLKAFELEKEAALTAYKKNIGEPSVSVLLKSAASLALNCSEVVQAEKMICLALSGEPPTEIAEELRNLLEDVHFQRHLSLQGIALESTELQLVVAGPGVGYGVVKSDLVFQKISTFEDIALRTAERKLGKPFRTSGRIENAIKAHFQPYISVPRAASMAFTIRLGLQDQFEIEGFSPTTEIINDIVENIGLVNRADFKALKEKIPDETYFMNFIGLSRDLAPDGKDVNLVGLSVIRNGHQKNIQFTRTREEITSLPISTTTKEAITSLDDDFVTITGRLFAANQDENNIRLKSEDNINYSVNVPTGLGDIVKKYWSEQVKIKGTQTQKNAVLLHEIDPA
ncbi:MAG: hypothetical protein EAZ92_11410 [Candidatus Kapaibacterium sp.]|nr:MAG: hypothetical protein EAZ92_11410 [Candidatus Kapabacteria bacterium]